MRHGICRLFAKQAASFKLVVCGIWLSMNCTRYQLELKKVHIEVKFWSLTLSHFREICRPCCEIYLGYNSVMTCWGIAQFHCPRKTPVQDHVVRSYFGCLWDNHYILWFEMHWFFQASIWRSFGGFHHHNGSNAANHDHPIGRFQLRH